jgi:excisionase family DNA binding protein
MYAADLMPIWLTKSEAADRARVSERTINNWIKWGWLRAGGTTRLVRIKPEWLDECLETLHGRDDSTPR